MKICCISDTHNRHTEWLRSDLPEADVLVHAGDFCGYGSRGEATAFMDWFEDQDYEHKVFICGNHEMFAEKYPLDEVRELLNRPGCTYLYGDETTIDGVKFWGGPWTPRFCDWAFNVDRGTLGPYWDGIPDNVNVLITHGPVHGILDWTDRDGPVGCENLRDRMKDLKQVDLHISGHIHPQYGTYHGKMNLGPIHVNASSCNDRYQLVNEPIVIEIDDNGE